MSDETKLPGMNASTTDLSPAPKSRLRFAVLCVTLLIITSLSGATALADTSANFFDVAKIVAVVAFIASMVALAIGMVGDAYRS